MFKRRKLPPEAITPNIAAKWGADVLDEGYVVFPKRLLRCLPAVFPKSKKIKELQMVLAIADYLRDDLTRGPSLSYLAFLAGLELAEAKRLLKKTKESGLITYRGSDDELEISNEKLRRKIIELTKAEDEGEDTETGGRVR